MKTVAVTGGIGSGKSSVCDILSSHGVPVYNCDAAAKRLYEEDDSLLDAVEEAFGCGMKLPGGGVDSLKLAAIVFQDPAKLAVLESIVHPAVLKDFLGWKAMKEAKFKGYETSEAFYGKRPFCVMESAIILEKTSFHPYIDKVVLVDAPLAMRLKRACDRDNVSAEKVIQRMSRQSFDLSKVDAVIRNDKTPETLVLEVERIFRSLGI